MKIYWIIFSFFLLSCSKTHYLIKQGLGQVALEWNDRDVADVLADPQIAQNIKNKILLIQEAKAYFYKSLQAKPTAIYDEVKFLDQDAVSYLVTVTPHDSLKPVMVSFPFYGQFPYLGFFAIDDAKDYAKEWSEKEHFTFMRPVYAYSTLNQWIADDNILSSFFHYDDFALVHMIMHELTHTVFFVKNEVSFNEHVAEYLAEILSQEFWANKSIKRDIKNDEMYIKRHKDYQKIVASFAKAFEQKLIVAKPTNKKEATRLLEDLFHNEIAAKFVAHCAQYKIIKCDNEVKYWNNARLSHYLTYDEHENELKIWLINKKLSAKALLEYLHSRYYHFRESKKRLSFWEFLRSEE